MSEAVVKFNTRFGRTGEILAEVLHALSLDLVAIISSYCVCGYASAGSEPSLVLGFRLDKWKVDRFGQGCTSLACSSENIYVGEQTVEVFSLDGTHLGPLSPRIDGWITGVAVDHLGNVFVSDNTHSTLTMYDASGSLVRELSISSRGCFGVAVHKDRVLLVEKDSPSIAIFELDGKFIKSFGTFGADDGCFRFPHGIAISADSTVAIVDNDNHRIQMFDIDGNFIRKFGGPKRGGDEGQFADPVGASFDRIGNLYVADLSNARIQVFKSDGSFITQFGEASWEPWAVCVDFEGRILVGNMKTGVSVFAFPFT